MKRCCEVSQKYGATKNDECVDFFHNDHEFKGQK
jgi:hypothetical protein